MTFCARLFSFKAGNGKEPSLLVSSCLLEQVYAWEGVGARGVGGRGSPYRCYVNGIGPYITALHNNCVGYPHRLGVKDCSRARAWSRCIWFNRLTMNGDWAVELPKLAIGTLPLSICLGPASPSHAGLWARTSSPWGLHIP